MEHRTRDRGHGSDADRSPSRQGQAPGRRTLTSKLPASIAGRIVNVQGAEQGARATINRGQEDGVGVGATVEADPFFFTIDKTTKGESSGVVAATVDRVTSLAREDVRLDLSSGGAVYAARRGEAMEFVELAEAHESKRAVMLHLPIGGEQRVAAGTRVRVVDLEGVERLGSVDFVHGESCTVHLPVPFQSVEGADLDTFLARFRQARAFFAVSE